MGESEEGGQQKKRARERAKEGGGGAREKCEEWSNEQGQERPALKSPNVARNERRQGTCGQEPVRHGHLHHSIHGLEKNMKTSDSYWGMAAMMGARDRELFQREALWLRCATPLAFRQ
eukprot:2790130-Pleurochrysis_carterae.AAC.1